MTAGGRKDAESVPMVQGQLTTMDNGTELTSSWSYLFCLHSLSQMADITQCECITGLETLS